MSPHAFSVSFYSVERLYHCHCKGKKTQKWVLTHIFQSVLPVKFMDETYDTALNSDNPRSLAYH